MDDPQGTASKISEYIAARISPTPRYEMESFPSDDGKKTCIKVIVHSGPDYPYYYAFDGVKEAYVRHGDRSEKTTDYELNNLILKGMNKTYDALPSFYSYNDVREVLVNAVIHRDYQIQGAEIHVDMYDDRMEITSPGGMMNGSRIQDLDILHVPSMRRNEVISDVFGRLHYMDRRGSGIGRIMNSYAEFVAKPEFYSSDHHFSVILPNRSVAELSQLEFAETQLSDRKTQLFDEKTQLSQDKKQLSQDKKQFSSEIDEPDWELSYFKEVVIGRKSEGLKNKTVDGIIELFDRYRYSYNFNRRNVTDLLNVTENRASRLIKKCMDLGIMSKVKRDEYCFKADSQKV